MLKDYSQRELYIIVHINVFDNIKLCFFLFFLKKNLSTLFGLFFKTDKFSMMN